ncbi:MAG: protein-methionine-sulfoxide reductase heme-binding subunit MsrQ [Anaerolineae bacterium]
MRKLKGHWLQILTHVAALLPLALLLWDYWQGRFIIDPVQEITTRTGKTALILLILSLACTPINTIFGFKQVMRVRRALGLYAFMYASLHFLTFIGLDYGFDFDLIAQDILDQRYVLVGFAAGLLLLPLAITSTQGWQKRLGKNWKRLHQLVYLASILAIVHFTWLVKDIREPLRYGAVVALLLIARMPSIRKAVSNARYRLKTR